MICLYHANCNDGAGAALAVWLRYGEKGNEYIPVQYGKEPPIEKCSGEIINIVDFSYKKDQIREIAKVAALVVIIDHHKTAQAELEGVDDGKGCDITTVFDMNKSGAVLAWEYFHLKPVPDLFLHIQDRDLWKFQIPGTRTVGTGLKLYPDWREWISLDLLTIQDDGAAIILFLKLQSEKIIYTKPSMWVLTGETVPLYNLPGFMLSDTLHQALVAYPESPYAVGYFDLPTKRVYSLRSRSGSDVDVSEIAKSFGGGGHKHAAGFSLEIEQ